MIDFDQIVDWHPKYKRFIISETELILISETENYYLSGEKYKDLIKHINGKETTNQIITKISDFYNCALFIQGVKSLFKNGTLKNTQQKTFYFLNKKHQPTKPFNDESIKVYNFSALIDSEIFQAFLNLKLKFSLIIVDDYLDPRIKAINKDHLRSKQHFLLIKPTGEKPLIGPLFSADENQPCWKCLSEQMLVNQPVKRWIQKRENLDYLETPTFFNKSTFDIEWFISLIFEVLKKENTCYELNNNSKSFIEHKVNHRPQCVTCGDQSLIKKQIQSPIILNDTPKIKGLDGGSRTVKPVDTVKKLQKFISPLSGIITDLTLITKKDENSISIYRSSFFSTPSDYKSINEDAFVKLSLGKGVADIQSRASALCETIERYAAQFQSDEFWCKSTPNLLDARYYLPNELAIFSEKQYDEFLRKDIYSGFEIHSVKKYSSEQPLHWVPTWSLTKDEKVYLPFTYCFSNSPFEDNNYIRWNSNGAAAGNTVEEAILQGFYELIERDATAIWWYNKSERQEIDFQNLNDDELQKINYSLKKEWKYWLLDITTDFEIPVIAAIAQHKETKEFCFGFGCHLNFKIATSRALTELCQLIPIRHQDNAPFDFKAIKAEAFLKGNGKKQITNFPNFESGDIKHDILYCVSKIKEFGYETLVINYSRPEIPIKTVKVIVPGLCFIWPQLGNKRLYEVPLKLNTNQKTLTESELNEMALYV